MSTVWFVLAFILVELGFERFAIIKITRNKKGREWVRNNKFMHPNSISFIRIPMGFVGIMLYHMEFKALGILWFAWWMITDLSDGTIARNCDLETEKGKWLDPFSDKCMYFPALLYFALTESVSGIKLPLGWVILTLILDFSGQFARLFIKKTAANLFGKGKTALITILISLVALNGIYELSFMSAKFFYVLTVSCSILAFLSVYCKVVPDTWYANTLTFCNFICGLFAIYSAFNDKLFQAFVLIFVGQFFDLFDGRLARIFGSTNYGAIFDDIADGANFGFAISAILFNSINKYNPALAAVCGIAYAGCVLFRLYRFTKHNEEMPKGTFKGIPSPAGAMLAGASAVVFKDHPQVTILMVVITCLLMTCSLQYRHFGQKIWPTCPRGMKMMVFILFLIFANMGFSDKNYVNAFALFCLVHAWIYVIYGLDPDKYWKPKQKTVKVK